MTKQYTDPDGNVLKADTGQDANGQYVAIKLGSAEVCRMYQASTYLLDDFEFGPSVKVGENIYQGQMTLINNCIEQFQIIDHQELDDAGNVTKEWTDIKTHEEPKPVLDPETKEQVVLKESGYFTYTVTPPVVDTVSTRRTAPPTAQPEPVSTSTQGE